MVLESLRDQTNVGALFRNAAALGAGAVILSPDCCDPLYRRSVRVSMGATLSLPFARAQAWPEELDRLGRTHTLVGLTPDPTAVELGSLVLDRERPVALLVGTEGAGLTGPALQRCDHRARIPMEGQMDSLNVATAAAVALYELGRRRPGPAGAP